MSAQFWIRRTPIGYLAIEDLGLWVTGSGAEIDLLTMFDAETIVNSADLLTAITADDVTRIDGPAGSTILAADAYKDFAVQMPLNGIATTFYNGEGEFSTPTGGVPAAHASTHDAGGADAMAIDAVAGTGSLRTIGTTATSACAGNDLRLSDARTPTAHAASHQSGGGDSIKLDDLATPDDNTDLNSSTARHGLLRKLDGVATNYLDGTGSFSVPPGTGGSGDVTGPASATPDALAAYADITGKVIRDSMATISATGVLASSTVQGNDYVNAGAKSGGWGGGGPSGIVRAASSTNDGTGDCFSGYDSDGVKVFGVDSIGDISASKLNASQVETTADVTAGNFVNVGTISGGWGAGGGISGTMRAASNTNDGTGDCFSGYDSDGVKVFGVNSDGDIDAHSIDAVDLEATSHVTSTNYLNVGVMSGGWGGGGPSGIVRAASSTNDGTGDCFSGYDSDGVKVFGVDSIGDISASKLNASQVETTADVTAGNFVNVGTISGGWGAGGGISGTMRAASNTNDGTGDCFTGYDSDGVKVFGVNSDGDIDAHSIDAVDLEATSHVTSTNYLNVGVMSGGWGGGGPSGIVRAASSTNDGTGDCFTGYDSDGVKVFGVDSNGDIDAHSIDAVDLEATSHVTSTNYVNAGVMSGGWGGGGPSGIVRAASSTNDGTGDCFTGYDSDGVKVFGVDSNGYVTANTATTTKPGLLPTLSGTATEFLNGSGSWATPVGSTPTYQKIFYPTDYRPLATPPGISTRTYNDVLEFDSATAESCFFCDKIRGYAGGNVLVVIEWTTAATSGNAKWNAAFDRDVIGTSNIDTDSWSSEQTTTTACHGTSGIAVTTTITFTSAQIDGVVDGDRYRLLIKRDATNAGDTINSNDCQIRSVTVTG